MRQLKNQSQRNSRVLFFNGVLVACAATIALAFRIVLSLESSQGAYNLDYLDNSVVEVMGVVDTVTLKGNQSQLKLESTYKNRRIQKATFRIYSNMDIFSVGDTLKVVGRFHKSSQGNVDIAGSDNYVGWFSYPDIEVIRKADPSVTGDIFNQVREVVNATVDKILPEPHASLLVGIVFGIERDLGEKYFELLRDTGVIHVVVASGFNAVIVSQLVLTAFSFFRKEIAVTATVVTLFVYAGIAGFQIPILRAIIMTGGQLLALLRGEYREGVYWLFISAYLLLLYDPSWLFSISFQLSFMASLGLVIFASDSLERVGGIPSLFRESLATTFIAQLFTFPIIWYHFESFSWKGLVVNALVLETVPLIMAFGGLAISVGTISASFGDIFIQPAWILLDYFLWVVEYFGSL